MAFIATPLSFTNDQYTDWSVITINCLASNTYTVGVSSKAIRCTVGRSRCRILFFLLIIAPDGFIPTLGLGGFLGRLDLDLGLLVWDGTFDDLGFGRLGLMDFSLVVFPFERDTTRRNAVHARVLWRRLLGFATGLFDQI